MSLKDVNYTFPDIYNYIKKDDKDKQDIYHLEKSKSICTTHKTKLKNSANMSVHQICITGSLFKSKVSFANYSMLMTLVSINKFAFNN